MQRPARLVVCETRLALSASLTAELIVSALDLDHGGEPADDATALLDQAAEVRESYGLDGTGQSIAVIDSGIAWDHVALGGGYGPGYRVVGGWDFAEDDADPYDDGPAGFHGSHVAGLLAGKSDSFSGIAPAADLVALRVFNDAGRGDLDAIESALQWVSANQETFENPITTVNLSLGAVLTEANAVDVQLQLEDELQQLHQAGIVVVAAAGNQFNADQPSQLAYPAASELVVGVGSVDAAGQISSFSQREPGLLVAPGESLQSTVPDHVLGWDGEVNDFATATGTSMASPQVAGAAAIVRSAFQQADPHAEVSPERILDHLRATAQRQIDSTTGMTYHVVDLKAAVEAILEGPANDGDSADPDPIPGDDAVEESSPTSDAPAGAMADAMDWGRIDDAEQLLAPEQWYRFAPSRTGWLSIHGVEDAAFQLIDANGQELAPEANFAGQYDLTVQAGQTLFVRSLAPAAASLRVTNLVAFTEAGFEVTGTSDADDVRLEGDGVMTVNGARYRLATGDGPAVLQIDGAGAGDQLRLQGSAGSDRLVVYPSDRPQAPESTYTSELWEVQFTNFEAVSLEGGGGADMATLHDSIGDDTLEARPGEAHLTGSGFDFRVTEVPRIYVHATAGGDDTAFLYDSAADETLAIRPQFTSLRGGGHFNLAYGFERVYAFANAGGNDLAQLYDSSGNDFFSASRDAATLSGSGYFASARGFESVEANATAGGEDTARLHGTAEVQWQQAGGLVQFVTVGEDNAMITRLARGFHEIEQRMPEAVTLDPQSLRSSSLGRIGELAALRSAGHPEAETARLMQLFATLGAADEDEGEDPADNQGGRRHRL